MGIADEMRNMANSGSKTELQRRINYCHDEIKKAAQVGKGVVVIDQKMFEDGGYYFPEDHSDYKCYLMRGSIGEKLKDYLMNEGFDVWDECDIEPSQYGIDWDRKNETRHLWVIAWKKWWEISN